MEKTIKLYDNDSHMYEFSASVISCVKSDKGYKVVLDRTAFFPEGGGQSADEGALNGIKVSDVQIDKDGIITHTLEKELPSGTEVNGEIDRELRFRRMQNHTGEHIVSGIIHKLFGYNNVGFHMGSECVTLDIDGYLSRDDLDRVEMLANRAVCENVAVRAEYPSAETLKSLDYRSKLDLTEDVRIVTIEGYDVCACCAPHVSMTGEIGVIKLLDSMKYKGGTRINMLSGYDALEDYNSRYKNTAAVSVLLKSKQSEIKEAVERIIEELNSEKQAQTELKKQLIKLKKASVQPTDGNLVLFEESMDMLNLRILVNETIELCGGICAAFSGNDNDGYNYVMASRTVPMRARSKEINSALCGRGGGSDEMIQGSVKTSAEEIRAYFAV
ncbi:MAG: alanyl-tRNA editing protein [Oscillospiraceae bacterium]